MRKKTNKDKCLEMWKWLAQNPTKNKEDYEKYLNEKTDHFEFDPCFACAEAKEKFDELSLVEREETDLCCFCPVQWTKTGNNSCTRFSSPYCQWLRSEENIVLAKRYAKEVVVLIETTWKE